MLNINQRAVKIGLPTGSTVGPEFPGSISILPSVVTEALLFSLVALISLTAHSKQVKIHSNQRKQNAQEGKDQHFFSFSDAKG